MLSMTGTHDLVSQSLSPVHLDSLVHCAVCSAALLHTPQVQRMITSLILPRQTTLLNCVKVRVCLLPLATCMYTLTLVLMVLIVTLTKNLDTSHNAPYSSDASTYISRLAVHAQ